MGVSPRRLAGWEPAEVTTFERDADGVVVRAVTVREAEFSRADVALLLASRRAARVPRNRLGIPFAEATDPARQYDWEVPLPVTDFTVRKLNAETAAYRKSFPDADMDSLIFTTVPKK